jgi:hypothetical protein
VDPWIAFPTPCQESTHQEFAMRSKHIGPRLGVAFAVQITILVGIGRLGLRRQRRLPSMRRALLFGVIEPAPRLRGADSGMHRHSAPCSSAEAGRRKRPGSVRSPLSVAPRRCGASLEDTTERRALEAASGAKVLISTRLSGKPKSCSTVLVRANIDVPVLSSMIGQVKVNAGQIHIRQTNGSR